MSAVVPSVLAKDRRDFDATLARVLALPGVESVQIDVVDGRFASPANWPANAPEELAGRARTDALLPDAGRVVYEVDLMTLRPEEAAREWLALGVSRVTLHAESVVDLARTLAHFRERYGHDPALASGLLSLGLALNIATPSALIEPYLDRIEYVQFMGIATIGRQGQPFDRRVLARLEAFHAAHPALPIQVDGAVSETTLPLLRVQGATRFIVGSGILRAKDPDAEYEKLTELAGV